jgi:hypothetical protein
MRKCEGIVGELQAVREETVYYSEIVDCDKLIGQWPGDEWSVAIYRS